jgi:hypothetical protein
VASYLDFATQNHILALPRSAIPRPTTNMKAEATNQPLLSRQFWFISQVVMRTYQTNPLGPAGKEYESVDAIEGRRPMIENAIPKISKSVKFLRSSCLYPSFAIDMSDQVLIAPPKNLPS